jgi:prefoldin subunit 5
VEAVMTFGDWFTDASLIVGYAGTAAGVIFAVLFSRLKAKQASDKEVADASSVADAASDRAIRILQGLVKDLESALNSKDDALNCLSRKVDELTTKVERVEAALTERDEWLEKFACANAAAGCKTRDVPEKFKPRKRTKKEETA